MSRPQLAARVFTEPLGGSALSRAIQDNALPGELQPWRPRSSEDWASHIQRVRDSAAAGWLDRLRPALEADGEAAARLARAADGGVVITTGQQAALFGGPLYTLAKALSALSLADTLQERLGVPVAPVFWAATDDADAHEAGTVYVADAQGLTKLSWSGRPRPGTPMSLAPLGDTTELLRQLRAACGSAAHSGYFDMARAAFSNGQTMGAAYVGFLRALLAPRGVAVLDSSHRAVREAAHPVLLRALDGADAVLDALAKRSRALSSSGYDPQVVDERGLSLVFATENGIRRRLPVSATARAERGDPLRLSPNVLLRPVVERALMPAAAYVAGPGELAYFAQVDAVADALDLARPVAVPRWSCMVVEPFVTRALERLGETPHALNDAAAIETRLARDAMPPAVTDAWTRLQQRLSASLDEVQAAVRDTGLVPAPVIEGLARSLQHRLARAERRLLAAAKRRNERARRDLAVAAAALYPLGQRQERVLNYVPMLARSGDELIAEMRRQTLGHGATLVRAERGEPVTR